MKYIIQGFVATDGSLVLTKNPNKFYPRIEAQVIHSKLIKQLYEYLLSLGLKGHSYLCKSKPDSRWKIVQDRYKFQFNGKENLLLFEQLIGFVNPKHKKRFIEFLKYDLEYDSSIKGLSAVLHKNLREPINFNFSKKVALGRF